MSASVVIRSGSIGAAVIAATIGFVNITLGSAIVGETRRVPVELATAANTDAVKAEYRRPVFIPFPKENPYTLAKAALGKKLYFDPRLSAMSAQSCASCHTPGFGWGDGLALGVGRGMAKLDRRSPTIINSAWGALFMWDGRAPAATVYDGTAPDPIRYRNEHAGRPAHGAAGFDRRIPFAVCLDLS